MHWKNATIGRSVGISYKDINISCWDSSVEWRTDKKTGKRTEQTERVMQNQAKEIEGFFCVAFSDAKSEQIVEHTQTAGV